MVFSGQVFLAEKSATDNILFLNHYKVMSDYYSSPQRAAEESRHGKAISDRVSVTDSRGKRVLAQLVYEKGDYYLSYAGAKSLKLRDVEYFSIIDRTTRWRPL